MVGLVIGASGETPCPRSVLDISAERPLGVPYESGVLRSYLELGQRRWRDFLPPQCRRQGPPPGH